MNATIQEIEGIDDYWGPAFRSVYEGEGHEAFVQQLDERIVQHDKEIEKLCNFHYQPKKKGRHAPCKSIKSAAVSTEYPYSKDATEGQCNPEASTGSHKHGHKGTTQPHYNLSDAVASSYNSPKPKRRRLDPRRLGGYSNAFPEADNNHTNDVNLYNSHGLDSSLNVDNGSDDELCSFDGYSDGKPVHVENDEGIRHLEVDSAGFSREEYDEITEYHTLAKQQNGQETSSKNQPNSSDLRLYLRNRKQSCDAYIEGHHTQMSEQRLVQGCKASLERQSGRSCGTSVELPLSYRQGTNDQGTSNHHNGGSHHVSDGHKRRSRHDEFDERYRSENRYTTAGRHHVQISHGSDGPFNNDISHVSPNLQVERGASNQVHRDESRSESGKPRIVLFQHQPHYDASTECTNPPAVVLNEPIINTSRDLRFYLKSKLTKGDDKVSGTFPSLHSEVSLSCDSSTGSNSLGVAREALYNSYSVKDYSERLEPTKRQHSQSHIESAESHYGESRLVSVETHPLCTDHHISQNQREIIHYNSETRYAIAKCYGQSQPLFSERQYSECRRHDEVRSLSPEYRDPGNHALSPEVYHDQSCSFSAEVQNDLSQALSIEHNRNQSPPISAELHDAQSRALPAEFHYGQSRSRELQSCTTSSKLPRGHSSPLSAELYRDPSRPAFPNLYRGQSPFKSTKPVHGQNRPMSELHRSQSKLLTAERHYGQSRSTSVEVHRGHNRPTYAELYRGESGTISAEVHRHQSRSTSSELHCVQSRPTSPELDRGQSRSTFTELHRGQSRPTSAELFRELSRPLSAKLYSDQSSPVSANLHRGPSRTTFADLRRDQSSSRSIELHRSQSRPTSAKLNRVQCSTISTELYRGQSRPTSAELYRGRSSPLFAELFRDPSRPASPNLYRGQSPLTSTELHRGQSRPTSAEFYRGESGTIYAEVHRHQSRPKSAELHFVRSRPTSAELHRGQSRPTSAELYHSQSKPLSAKLHRDQSRHTSASLRRAQSRTKSAELHRGQRRPMSQLHRSQNNVLTAEPHYGQSRSTSAELHRVHSRPTSAEIHRSQSRLTSAQLHLGQSITLPAELHRDHNRPLSAKLYREESRPLSSEIHHDQSRILPAEHYYDESRMSFAERQHDSSSYVSDKHHHEKRRNMSTERHSTILDVKPEPISISVGSKESNRDKTAFVTTEVNIERSSSHASVVRHCSPTPVIENDFKDDPRCNLTSYLKSKIICRREACAALSRRRASSESQRCPSVEIRGNHKRSTTTESQSDERYETARRRCSTPDPEVKSEPNDNASNEVVASQDEFARVLCKISEHLSSKSSVHAENKKTSSSAEIIIKSEPNECSSNDIAPDPNNVRFVSNVVVGPYPGDVESISNKVPLTIDSQRGPYVPDLLNKVATVKEEHSADSNDSTFLSLNVPRSSPLERESCPKDSQPSLKESQSSQKENQSSPKEHHMNPTYCKPSSNERRHNISGFIDSIRELLEVRSHAEELHAEISDVDANVKETTEGLCTKAEELIRARRVELNIAATIEKMELCLPLLTTYSKLKSQVEAKRYYPALKTLEQLEHVLLPRVGPYKWCGTISADIPRLRQAIRDASMADLRDFLENIRKLSPQVGAMALKQSQEMMGRNLATIVKNKKDKMMLSTSEIEAAPQCPHELVDFSPLHRCLHIHTVLGAKNDFIQYYRAQRKQQARLVLIPASANLHDSIRGVKDYLNAVLGFFILEEHLLSAAAGLVSKDWLLDTWSMSINKVASTLRTNTSLITDPTLMLSIKHQIVLFISTVKCYGLPVEPLPTLLQEMAEHYTEVLMQRWVVVFRDILDKAAFTPIQVQNEEEYDDVVNNFPYDASDLEMQPFPKSFPFSSIVPSVYLQVKEFIYAWLKYSSGLGLGGGRRAAAARHSASLLLSRSFTGCLSALFHSPLPLMQLVQIIVDTQYLEDATVCLYEFISNITGSGPVFTQPVAGLFQSARDEAEQQICDNLQKKVDEFLDLENYDWLLVEPTGQASSFVTDMISYLKGVMESLHQLPEQARVAAVRAATNRIAVRLRNLLLEPAVKQISSGALYQLDLDVMQCEQFAASEPVTGLREGELLEHFASLRQLLDLITGWDWSSYLHDVGIEGGKYALVTPRDAATLLEKFKEAEQKSSVFSVLKKNERDKRKLLDTVLKQLKQLQNQDGS